MAPPTTRAPEPPPVHRFDHQPLLGTAVQVRCQGTDPVVHLDREQASAVDEAVVSEIRRLEQVFSAFDASSDLERWKRGELVDPAPELGQALALALVWQERSEGRFNTASGEITALWRRAEAMGIEPSAAERAEVCAAIAGPRYVIDSDGRPRLTGEGQGINLNAFVKGWIVDRAVEAGRAVIPGIDLLVSAGGDLCHRGPGSAPVGIENPLRPYDNEPPLTMITVANQGLATSGRARRGFRVGQRWYAHVVDPRTGATVDHTAAISVVADDTATADVVATIAGLMEADQALAYCGELGLACLVVTAAGEIVTNDRWPAPVSARPGLNLDRASPVSGSPPEPHR